MPDRFRGGAFEPEFVSMLVDVFETVCAKVQAQNGDAPSIDLRDRIAKAIMHQAAIALEQAGLNAVLGGVE